MKVEYKVREVKRYVVTRYEEAQSGLTGGSSVHGNFDNYETAYHVAYALADSEQRRLGLPLDSLGVIFPAGNPEASISAT